ncbi:MAG: hypothetical protein CMN15_13725 [Roseovarius sp.]|nr:hypothetical protein [Roseovarius sp.]
MSARAALTHLLEAARDWHVALPEFRAFASWPDDLRWADRPAHALPVIDHLTRDPGHASDQSLPLRDALVAAAPHVEWRHSYTEAEVGRDFLNRFGWFELAGPSGHFLTQSLRVTVGYWGPGLDYGWHEHLPEELYSVVSGRALFHLRNAPDLMLESGQTRFHPANAPHAMTTLTDPILTLVLWRGAGLGDDPRMSQ